jgi:hypothetical protein
VEPFNPVTGSDTPTAPQQPDPEEVEETEEGNDDENSDGSVADGNSLLDHKRFDGLDNSAKAAEARALIENEQFEERRQEFMDAEPVDQAVERDHRTFDAGLIREAYEKDRYVRDGNILYPAPLERPAGASPSFVGEVVEMLGAIDEDVRKRADEKQGLDPDDRTDRDRLEKALAKK